MDLIAKSQSLMGMDERVWARHANPWSVYTRFSILPLLALAIWSRAWLGWGALIPLAAVIVWTWANPRLFPPPRTKTGWAARGTFGERVYLNRATVAIPPQHTRWARGLVLAAGAGVVVMAWGLWRFSLSWTLLGLVLSMGAKAWLVDRMAFLYDDMARRHAPYRDWARADG